MSFAPGLYSDHVLLAAEVSPVLRFAQPPALSPPLTGAFALRRRTVLLSIPCPRIRQIHLLAVQALAFPSSHRLLLVETADARRKRLRRKENPSPRRRWVKKTKKMIPMNLQEEDPAEENRFSNRPNYPNIIPPLRDGGIRDKDHVQICVRNPNCIKGYFRVLDPVPGHPIP